MLNLNTEIAPIPKNTLQGLKPDKSPGPDMIHPRVLKECANELAYPLFRKSLDDGNVPRDWKDSNVTPIYKKGSRTSVDNYRPVSLTSVVCKVMERLLRKPLLEHMFTYVIDIRYSLPWKLFLFVNKNDFIRYNMLQNSFIYVLTWNVQH